MRLEALRQLQVEWLPFRAADFADRVLGFLTRGMAAVPPAV